MEKAEEITLALAKAYFLYNYLLIDENIALASKIISGSLGVFVSGYLLKDYVKHWLSSIYTEGNNDQIKDLDYYLFKDVRNTIPVKLDNDSIYSLVVDNDYCCIINISAIDDGKDIKINSCLSEQYSIDYSRDILTIFSSEDKEVNIKLIKLK